MQEHSTTESPHMCPCGCGQPSLTPNLPLRGHHWRMKRKRPESQPCACGCGQFTTVRKRSKEWKGYVPGHKCRWTPPPMPVHLCECGCGQPTNIIMQPSKRRGDIKGQHRRFVRYHHRTGKALPTVEERFWAKVDKSPEPDGCWLWTGKPDTAGYGIIGLGDHKTMGAHRFSYQLVNGPIPDGLDVCHDCDARYAIGDITYRRCVRPDHLFLGTQADNVADCVKKGRFATGERSASAKRRGIKWGPSNRPYPRGEECKTAKLTEQQVREIRERHAAGGTNYVILAKVYGVTSVTIGDIVRRKWWRHIP